MVYIGRNPPLELHMPTSVEAHCLPYIRVSEENPGKNYLNGFNILQLLISVFTHEVYSHRNKIGTDLFLTGFTFASDWLKTVGYRWYRMVQFTPISVQILIWCD